MDKYFKINLVETQFSSQTNTVSLTLQALQGIQVQMLKTLHTVFNENNDLNLLSDIKRKSVLKKLEEIKDYLEKEEENVSDLIFSLKEAIISEEN